MTKSWSCPINLNRIRNLFPAPAPDCLCPTGLPSWWVTLLINSTSPYILPFCKGLFPVSLHPLLKLSQNIHSHPIQLLPPHQPLRKQGKKKTVWWWMKERDNFLSLVKFKSFVVRELSFQPHVGWAVLSPGFWFHLACWFLKIFCLQFWTLLTLPVNGESSKNLILKSIFFCQSVVCDSSKEAS